MSAPLGDPSRAELREILGHDLKTPLTVIAGYAELLRMRDDEETRRQAPLQILEAVERLRSELDALALRFAPAPVSAAVSPRRLLVVDDDEHVRTLLNATLAGDEFDLVDAADGERALELADDVAPDLVVLDWQLPGRSGADVLAELKQRRPEPRVLVLTADRDAAERAGQADAFLTKPFSPVQLLVEIERLLQGR